MSRTERVPVLADAADVLSDQLRTHLKRLAALTEPHIAGLDRKFLSQLRKQKLDERLRTALLAITPGAAARVLKRESPEDALRHFFEHVEYHGRRLAKLNLPPSAVATALDQYNELLTGVLQKLGPEELANLHWVREQLHFCVILTLNNAYYQVREAESSAFYELFRIELEARNLEELLKRFLEALVGYCRADEARLYLLNEDASAWVLQAAVGSESAKKDAKTTRKRSKGDRFDAVLEPWSRHSGGFDGSALAGSWKGRFATVWSVPMTSGDRPRGVIQFAFAKPYEWLPREQELLQAAAERCLMAAEKARLMEDLAAREEQVRQLAAHMLQVEEMERRRISRELHDEAGQSLLCIRLQMEMLEPLVAPELRPQLKQVREATERTIVDIRRLIAALSPAVLESLGLEAALRQLVKRFQQLHSAKVRLHMHRLQGLNKKLTIIVYRLAQECFNNIAKHSEASTVNLFVGSADGSLKLIVEDNGVGFAVDRALGQRDSFGLAGMMERVALFGGKFEVQSRPARKKQGKAGTRISIELPIPPG